MASYYESVQDLIGRTPLLKINNFELPENVNLFAKLELWNPGGSVKDRVGVYMVRQAEESGLLHPGSTIVEGTAGNMGIGIALAAVNRGYRVIFAVPEKFSEEKQVLMRALGAEIVHTPLEDGMLGAQAKAEELAREIPDAVPMRQFKNPANPQAHYETTGPEIWDALDGHIDVFVAGAGSGGTYSGVVRYFKEHNPAVRGVMADPVGSTMGGGEHGDYAIEGIGNDFIADTMDMSLVDQVIKVNDDQAFNYSRLLAQREGIFAGSSSGAALYAALKVARDLDAAGVEATASPERPVNVVTLFPDRGDRYFSKHLFA